MRTIEFNVSETGCQETPMFIGYQGENAVTRVIVNYSAWVEEFGTGTLSLEVMRAGDTAPYLAPLTVEDDQTVWTVSDVDTGARGEGAAGFVYTVDEQVKKSAVFRFFVARDVGGTPGDRPNPYEGLITYMERLTAQTEENASAAAESASAAAGSATTATQQAQAAATARTAAETAQQTAETAQGAAETAQTAAESARDAAASSATAAAGSAATATQQAQAAATARAAAEAAQQAAETAKNYAQTFTGAPRVAASAAQMTDTDLIYVYTGTTSGTLTTGHWYYWDGSAWTDGGVYNSSAVQTDPTLTVSGAPADAKATGDAVGDLKSATDDLTDCARLGLIPYACNGENTNVFTVSQEGNEVTINGTSNATASQVSTKVSLSGRLYSWNSSTTPDSVKIYPIKLFNGHTYKLKISLISGTLDEGGGTGTIRAIILNENESRLARVDLDSEADTEVTFVSNGDKIRVGLLCSRLMTLTNAKIRLELSDKTIEDIPDEIAGKQDILTFDNVPTKDSENPVKSGGIYNSIKTQIENSTGVKILEYTPGYMIALGAVGSVVDLDNPVQVNGAYAVGDVIPGQTIKCMLTNGSTSYRAFAFINENNEIVQKATSNNTAGEVTLIAPHNASKLILNAYQYTTHEHWATIYPIGSDKPWSGLYVSLLGDSISALQYYIPSGNQSYYGPNKGTEYQRSITQPQQMWWYKIITGLGGTPLIIDAWSGSSVTVDGGDAGTIAMCELSRCNNLHAWVQTTAEDPDAVEVTEANIGTMRTSPFLPSYTPAVGDFAKRINPDIVLSTGGTNDWTYAETAESIGTYDGHTALPNPYGETPAVTTFREAYATMVCRIQNEYPFALVICSTGFFNCRPYTQKYQGNKNSDSGLTMQDYANAIREIAAIRACPVVSVWENGFNKYNYYDTFAGDSDHQPTHPNELGHQIISENAIPSYAHVCEGYVKWLRENR